MTVHRATPLRETPQELKNLALLIPSLRKLYDEQAELRSALDKLTEQRDAALEDARRLRTENAEMFARLFGKLSVVEAETAAVRRSVERRSPGSPGGFAESLVREYLDLLEKCLTGTLYEDPGLMPTGAGAAMGLSGFREDVRFLGRDWPARAETMIGVARMRNLRDLIERALFEPIQGDFIEAGVWRGGACIYARGILKAYGVTDRRVWVADSFCGLPPPNPGRYPADHGDAHHTFSELAVSLEEVKRNFARYGLLDDKVEFLVGWFKDSLPVAPIQKVAVLRLDGDMYESTMDTLGALYDRVSTGGFVIVDDYILPACRQAVNDFRAQRRIADALVDVDGAAVWWRKGQSPAS